MLNHDSMCTLVEWFKLNQGFDLAAPLYKDGDEYFIDFNSIHVKAGDVQSYTPDTCIEIHCITCKRNYPTHRCNDSILILGKDYDNLKQHLRILR